MRPPLISTWAIGEARKFLKELQAILGPLRWHVALAGGVLHRGRSTHDLDVIVFPRKAPIVDGDLPRLKRGLRKMGMRCYRHVAQMHRYWASKCAPGEDHDAKVVEVWKTREGKRVDLLILS